MVPEKSQLMLRSLTKLIRGMNSIEDPSESPATVLHSPVIVNLVYPSFSRSHRIFWRELNDCISVHSYLVRWPFRQKKNIFSPPVDSATASEPLNFSILLYESSLLNVSFSNVRMSNVLPSDGELKYENLVSEIDFSTKGITSLESTFFEHPYNIAGSNVSKMPGIRAHERFE